MRKASVLTIRVPSDLKHRIVLVAEEQGVSINQLAMYMFTKEIGNLEVSQNIAKYWKDYSMPIRLTPHKMIKAFVIIDHFASNRSSRLTYTFNPLFTTGYVIFYKLFWGSTG